MGEVLAGATRRVELVGVEVVSVDRAARELLLTIEGRKVEEDKAAINEYGSSDSGASLGDILSAAIRRRSSQAPE